MVIYERIATAPYIDETAYTILNDIYCCYMGWGLTVYSTLSMNNGYIASTSIHSYYTDGEWLLNGEENQISQFSYTNGEWVQIPEQIFGYLQKLLLLKHIQQSFWT